MAAPTRGVWSSRPSSQTTTGARTPDRTCAGRAGASADSRAVWRGVDILDIDVELRMLIDGKLVLYESMAINHYLADRYDGGLRPADEIARAKADADFMGKLRSLAERDREILDRPDSLRAATKGVWLETRSADGPGPAHRPDAPPRPWR